MLVLIIYNCPPKGRWIVVDIYRDAKLFTDPKGDSCFSIYQIRWIKKCFFDFFFWNFRETTCHFSLGSQNRIFRVTRANQNARKLLSTDLVKLILISNVLIIYYICNFYNAFQLGIICCALYKLSYQFFGSLLIWIIIIIIL